MVLWKRVCKLLFDLRIRIRETRKTHQINFCIIKFSMISQKKRKSSSQYENEVSYKVVVDFTKH